MSGLLRALFWLAGHLPLRLNHAFGAALGQIVGRLSARHRQTTASNIARFVSYANNAATCPDAGELIKSALSEQGKSVTELAVVWTASVSHLDALVQSCDGWHLVEAAQASTRPIIFVSPHLGCYEMAGRYVAHRVPIAALYRPPKLAWLAPLMQIGRARGGATTVPADATGVRVLLKTLKQGGSIFILPDQVPAAEKGGEGVWASFFGQAAYTMTLLPRLAQTSNAVVIYVFAERLPNGRGYIVHLQSMPEPYAVDKTAAARQTNQMVERLTAQCPSQYLGGYNRYKQPAGAPPAPSEPAQQDID